MEMAAGLEKNSFKGPEIASAMLPGGESESLGSGPAIVPIIPNDMIPAIRIYVFCQPMRSDSMRAKAPDTNMAIL